MKHLLLLLAILSFPIVSHATTEMSAVYVIKPENYKDGMTHEEIEKNSWLFFPCRDKETRRPYCEISIVIDGKYLVSIFRGKVHSSEQPKKEYMSFSCKVSEKTESGLWREIYSKHATEYEPSPSDNGLYVCNFVRWLDGGHR